MLRVSLFLEIGAGRESLMVKMIFYLVALMAMWGVVQGGRNKWIYLCRSVVKII